MEQVKQTEIFINEEELAEGGATLRDVAEFVMTLTQGDLESPGISNITDVRAPVFAAAFPSETIPSLPCAVEDLEAGT